MNSFDRLRGKLHLSRKDAWLAGVCGGIAETFGLDANVVRVGGIIAGLFAWKFAIAAYLIAWLVLDER